MKILFAKHIHSSNSSYSSNDVIFKMMTTLKTLGFSPEEDQFLEGLTGKHKKLNDERIESIEGDEKFMYISLKSNTTFQNGGFFSGGNHDFSGFKGLVKSYKKKGWKVQSSKDIPSLSNYFKRCAKREEQRAKEEGLVLWMDYDDRKTEDYQGGFSPEVFNGEKLHDYVTTGVVFGWIGDSGSRKPEHDKVIETGLKKRGLSPEQMYNWISSGDGRHFADSLSFFDRLEDQIEEIEMNLNRIYNCCLIYGAEDHGGTLDSTIEIRERYEDLGILLPEDKNAEYAAGGHLKMFAALLTADKVNNGKKLSKIEKALMEDMKDTLEQQKLSDEAKNLIK